MQRLYRKFQPNESANIKFSTKFVSTLAEAYQACSEGLSNYIRQRHGPTIVIAQGKRIYVCNHFIYVINDCL